MDMACYSTSPSLEAGTFQGVTRRSGEVDGPKHSGRSRDAQLPNAPANTSLRHSFPLRHKKQSCLNTAVS